MTDEQLMQMAQQVVRVESEAVAGIGPQLDAASLRAAAGHMLACTGKVLVAGVGTSHATALRMAHLLSCCGTPALFIHPGDAIHGTSGAFAEGDVLVVISKGGKTDEVNKVAAIAKARGARLIALTEAPQSALGQMADVNVVVRTPADVDPYGMIATGSSLVYSATADVLCVLMLEMRGYTKEQFGKTHPGGAVGKTLAAEGEAR